MDNLTHGLLGLTIGALRRPDGGPGKNLPFSSTDKAVLVASFVAAELPDLDNFLPAANPVMHALHAHRGLSHALAFAPVWALLATALACLIFRGARRLPAFGFALAAVLFAHIASDLWTGWGTRAWLPFSDARLSLDITSVVDPFFTLPLIVAAGWALARRRQWRSALIVGLAISSAYLGFRTVSRAALLDRIERSYPEAGRVEVFPALLSASLWRYVAVLPEGYAAGAVPIFGDIREQRRIPFSQPLPEELIDNSTVDEALAWARLPLISVQESERGSQTVEIADLRYHLGGAPTLSIVIEVDADGRTIDARLERGGSTAEILERWRSSR